MQDLENYLSAYTGRTRLKRLQFIAKQCEQNPGPAPRPPTRPPAPPSRCADHLLHITSNLAPVFVVQGPSLRIEALRLALAEVEGGPQPQLQVDIAGELITECATAQAACVGRGLVVLLALSFHSRWYIRDPPPYFMVLFRCFYYRTITPI